MKCIESSAGATQYRLFAYQPISLTLEKAKPLNLIIQKIPCQLALRNIHDEKMAQNTHGGMFVTLDFSLTNENDLLRATQKGIDLINDFFSGVSLVEGAIFNDTRPIQIIRIEKEPPPKYRIIHFLDISLRHWHKPISKKRINEIQSILAHWDGLDGGKRLRRAARQFHKSKGVEDVLTAFQHAYMGLEAMEKPLANALNISPGVEEVKGRCNNCSAEYTRKRTVLAGVRAYICGDRHPETSDPERRREWKEINDLRTDLFHSLEDIDTLEDKACKVLPAAMHYLHDSICCMSHSHHLESPRFELYRGVHQFMLLGQFSTPDIGPLKQWRPFLEVKTGSWAEHPRYGLVPRFSIHNHGVKDLELTQGFLELPLGTASENDIVFADVEHK